MKKTASLFNINIFTESLKQNKYIIILHMLVLFAATTLPVYIQWRKFNESTQMWFNRAYYNRVISGCSPIMLGLAVLIVMLVVIYNFSYLFKNNSMQFYNSMPYSRECMYLSKAGAAMVTLFGPLTFVTLVNSILYNNMFKELFEGFEDGRMGYVSDVFLIYLFLMCILLFSVSVSGNVFASIFTTGFVIFSFLATMLAIIISCYEWFSHTYIEAADGALWYVCPILAPCLIDESTSLTTVVHGSNWAFYMIINSVIFFAAGYVCYKIRKSERGNKFVVFEKLSIFLQYYISCVASLGIGGVVAEIIDLKEMLILIYGIVFVLFSSLLKAIFEKNIHQLFKNMKPTLIACVVWMVVLIPFASGMVEADAINENLCYKIRVSTNDFQLTTNDREIIKRTKEQMLTEGEGGEWISVNEYTFIPGVEIEYTYNYTSDSNYEDYMNYVMNSTSCRKAVSESFKNGVQTNLTVQSIDYYESKLRNDISDEINLIYQALSEEVMMYDYETEKASGVFAVMTIPRYFQTTYGVTGDIKIYNCYKDTVSYIKQYTGFEEFVVPWDYLALHHFDTGEIYSTNDKEIIKKILLSAGGGNAKECDFIVKLTDVEKHNPSVSSAVWWMDIYVDYDFFIEEIKNIINPYKLSFEELAENKPVQIEF